MVSRALVHHDEGLVEQNSSHHTGHGAKREIERDQREYITSQNMLLMVCLLHLGLLPKASELSNLRPPAADVAYSNINTSALYPKFDD